MANRLDVPDPLRDVTILRGIVGSTAYGLNHADSDIDRLGCYVAPTVQFHGFNPPVGKSASKVQHDPDITEHEIGKLFSLLLKCNPTVTELLWLPDGLYEIVHPEGLALIQNRESFLSARMVKDAFLGYAMAQFKRLSERGDGSFSSDTRKRTAKHARHLMRLCYQGFTLWSEGTLPIRLDDPEPYFAFGEAVAKDANFGRDLLVYYEKRFDTSECVLPEEPDRDKMETLLLEIRANHYDATRYTGLTPEQRARQFLSILNQNHIVAHNSPVLCDAAIKNLTKSFK